MNTRPIYPWCMATAMVALHTGLAWRAATAQPPDPANAEAGIQILTRGPVHEAFAETVTYDPQPGLIAPKTPPAAIEELPPEQRPEGVNVAWIPGYFAWDEERRDFLWVSGIWRALPPGRQWVPGYWSAVARRAQWISGYWADAQLTEVEYLPEPPQSVEAGSNIAAPSPDQTWLPGTWMWHQNRYVWRPGYWAAVNPNWDWVPAHYVWTPRGYVYIGGYYDYSVARRGVLFAPVYFDQGIYARRGFSYSPVTVINPAVFAGNLFLRPSYQHYYFGDYYAANYISVGYYPSYSYHTSRYGYDPIYAQQRWENRQVNDWERNQQMAFQNRRDHENARPPRTWAAQQTLITSGATTTDKNLIMAATLDQVSKTKEGTLRFQPVNQAERQQLGQRSQAMHQFRDDRLKLEAKGAIGAVETPGLKSEPGKLKMPSSPIISQPVDKLGKEHAPPKAHDFPKPDSKIEPRPRTVAGGTTKPVEPTVPPKVPPKVDPTIPPKVPPKLDPIAPPKVPPKIDPTVPPKVPPKVDPTIPPKVPPKLDPIAPPKVPPKVDPITPPKVSPTVPPKVTPPVVPPKVAPIPPVAPKVAPPAEKPKGDPKKEPPKA